MRFRRRAADCRLLAKNARDSRDRELLHEIAEDLEAEAEKIKAEDRGQN